MQRTIKKELKLFKRCHGYDLDLDNPKTFNEKLCHSKLFNRNPLMTQTSDKYRARQYIRSRVPDCEKHLVPIYIVFYNPGAIRGIALPDKYVMKPNHGSGWWIEKNGDYTVNVDMVKYQDLDESVLESIVRAWLVEDYSLRWNEWAYKDIERLVVVEKSIGSPNDYRLNMFDGKFKFLAVTTPYQKTFNYFDEDLKPVHLNLKPELEDFKMSGRIRQMIKWAEMLSKGWDFIRCDFMVTDKVYFSELTHYPGAGNVCYPYDFDLKLGEYWR